MTDLPRLSNRESMSAQDLACPYFSTVLPYLLLVTSPQSPLLAVLCQRQAVCCTSCLTHTAAASRWHMGLDGPQ